MDGETQRDFKLNTEGIRKLADQMKKVHTTQPESYDQRRWGNQMTKRLLNRRTPEGLPQVDWPRTDCGTATCMAGWAVALLGEQEELKAYREMHGVQAILEYAHDLLGLDNLQESAYLFAKEPYRDRPPTALECSRMLRNLADTGELDWKAGRPGEPGVARSKPAGA